MIKIVYPVAVVAVLLKKIADRIWELLHRSLFASCGSNVRIWSNCEFTHSHIHIGSNVAIGSRCSFIAAVSRIYIGNNVMFGPNVTIRGGNHRIDVVGEYMFNVTEKLPENDQDVHIADDVWVGCNVTILKGVTIGEGSVIGAGSLVVKDVPPYTVYIGMPAQKIRPRWPDEVIAEHKGIIAKKSSVFRGES